jgi:hypothetical protein
MKIRTSMIATIFASLVGATAAMPVAMAVADTAPTGCNSDAASSAKPPTANYDGFDRFRDPTGRPLPGWEYLFNSPG